MWDPFGPQHSTSPSVPDSQGLLCSPKFPRGSLALRMVFPANTLLSFHALSGLSLPALTRHYPCSVFCLRRVGPRSRTDFGKNTNQISLSPTIFWAAFSMLASRPETTALAPRVDFMDFDLPLTSALEHHPAALKQNCLLVLPGPKGMTYILATPWG